MPAFPVREPDKDVESYTVDEMLELPAKLEAALRGYELAKRLHAFDIITTTELQRIRNGVRAMLLLPPR